MPIIPPTPFLPHSKHFLDDQTLLIDTEPIYDDSFGSWPPTPGRVGNDTGRRSAEVDEDNVGVVKEQHWVEDEVYSESGEGSLGSAVSEAAWSGMATSTKRIGGSTPMKKHIPKKAKAPTPVKDDFYARRLKDSDRRSSLGPKDLEPQTLFRSTSRSSIRSNTSTSRQNPFLSASSTTSLGGPSTYLNNQTPPSLPSPLYPLSRQTSASSTSLPSTSTVRGFEALHRTVSNLSESSRSRRDSISDKVSGFFSRLLRASSSRVEGADIGETGRATESDDTRAAELPGDRTTPQELGSEEDSSQQTNRNSLNDDAGDALGQPSDDQAVEDEASEEEPDTLLHPVRNVSYNNNGPKLRLPPPLTRPAPRHLTTATRALQPKRTVLGVNHSSLQPKAQPKAPVQAKRKDPSDNIGNPAKGTHLPRPPPSSFTARALSRLPAPGKGSTSSARPTIVRSAERAADLQMKKDRFELLAKQAAEERQKALSTYSSRPTGVTTGLKRTVPISGNTPGKASRQRAEERARFERGLKQRHDEKERRDEEMRRAKEELEAAEERVRRGERVVWAKGMPEMYKRGRDDV